MNRNFVHQEEYKGFTITLEQDDDPTNPREWSNLGMMVCAHNSYLLGDFMLGSRGWVDKSRKDEDVPFYPTVDGFKEWLTNASKNGSVLYLPLFLYDHGGITMRTGSFGDPWDSGQVGYIYVTKEKILEEYGWKNLSSKRKQKILEHLRAEVQVYDDYLVGDVYGWCTWRGKPDDNDMVDSVWGYFGKQGELQAIEDAKASVDFTIRQEIKTDGQQLILPGFEGHLSEEVQLEGQRLGTLTDTGR